MRSGRKNEVDNDGRFVDPWGNAYQIALDNNFDNQTIYSNSVYSVTNVSSSVVVSFGPNGKPDDPAKPGSDDIISSR